MWKNQGSWNFFHTKLIPNSSNVVDDTLRGKHDNKTIGLLLCNGGDKVVAQYALSGYDQPIGVSDYQLSKAIPDNLKSALPTVEDVEEELSKIIEL